jgi:Ninjurin
MHDASAACYPDGPDSNSRILPRPEFNRQMTNDMQSFVQKKNIAQGMMDLALVSANCNQLRYVLDMNHMHPYYMVSLVLIGTSLALQVIVGLGLLYSNR